MDTLIASHQGGMSEVVCLRGSSVGWKNACLVLSKGLLNEKLLRNRHYRRLVLVVDGCSWVGRGKKGKNAMVQNWVGAKLGWLA